MQSHRAVWSRCLLLVGSVILLSCGKEGAPPPGDDAGAAARSHALAQWKQAPSATTALALTQAYFPGLETQPGATVPSSLQLQAQLASDGALTLSTRGLTFHVQSTSDSAGALRREDAAAFQGDRHLWWPVGPTTSTAQGWHTSRVEEAWILDAQAMSQGAEQTHRAEYTVTLPSSVRRILDTGDSLQFLDENARPVLRFHPAVVRDANGQSREGSTRLSGGRVNPSTRTFDVEGGQVRITTEVALAGLTAPLVVDPGWSSTAAMATARGQHTGILLGTGKLLVAGGVNRTGFVTTAELYDPDTATWSAAAAPGITGNISSSAHLADGRVLVMMDGSTSGRIYDPATDTWSATSPMAATRSLSTITRLDSGQLLVAGGSSLATAELYDPVSNTFLPTGSMSLARRAHTATRLRDGRVLAVSGFDPAVGEVAGADLYDPASGTWTPAAPPLVPRHYATGTLLPDGRVLFAGGRITGDVITQAEIFDPLANTWTATGSLNFPRSGHTAVLLPNGRVLVTGGSDFARNTQTASELYDPATGTWTVADAMATGRENGATTLLPSGKVLTTGGFHSDPSLTFYADTDVYDPGVQSWFPAGVLGMVRVDPLMALLPNGRVLVVGGRDGAGTALATSMQYDRAANTWSATGGLSTVRADATATTLASGEVLVVGGTTAGGALATTERYALTTNAWNAAGSLARARHSHTATRLTDGRVLAVGGHDGVSALASAELYDPASQTWSSASPPAVERAAHAAALLPDGRVLVAGGRNTSGAALASAEVYDPVSNTWTPVGSLAQGREHFTLTLMPTGELLAAGGAAGGVALASTERYSATSNAWTPDSPLTEARWRHTATLMPSGTLLVAGGLSAPATYVASAEAYGAPSRVWTPVSAPNARGGVAAVALPSGEVLLAGGTAATTAERYEEGLPLASWRPVVETPDEAYQTCPLVITGRGFRGISGASNGSYLDSPTDFPLVRLRAAEGGRLWTLPATGMSATSATVRLPAETRPGPHALSVFANAIPGGRMVTVLANTAPTVDAVRIVTIAGLPQDVTLTATDAENQPLTWTIVTPPQHGTLSGTPPNLTYTPNAGYVGADSFTYRASDCGLDSTEATADVIVETEQPLAITCPEDQVLEATGPDGAPGQWPPATATASSQGGTPTITYSPAEGATLPLGTTTVTATAEDSSGARVTCTFQVEVRDTTPPALTCPSDIRQTSDDASGATVTFTLPQATDNVSTPTVTASPPSGSTFRHGSNTVTVTATDASGNEARCTFQVTVQATVISIAGGGCQSTGSGTASALALLVTLASWSGLRRRSRHVSR